MLHAHTVAIARCSLCSRLPPHFALSLCCSSLMGKDLMGGDGTNPPVYDYYLSVCGVLTSTPTAPCTQIMSSASACQIQVSGGTGTFDVGNWIAGQNTSTGRD